MEDPTDVECSTPEGIEAATTSRSSHEPARHRQVLNARGHRSGDDHPELLDHEPHELVLNARGHRSGDDFTFDQASGSPTTCSTPEGIEAATTSARRRSVEQLAVCSTPEGIEAATTMAVDAPHPPLVACSTPEGIEAATTWSVAS